MAACKDSWTRTSREAARTLCAAGVVVVFGLVLYAGDPTFFWADDNQMQHLAARCDIARAWRGGEVPLLSPYSWHCGALAGEYQYAVFSPFESLLVIGVFALDLSLRATAAALALTYLGIMAAGAFRLGRVRGLSSDLALLTALVTSLNGWVMIWGAKTWLPGLASLAWLPWFWWGLERAVAADRGPLRFAGAGVLFAFVAVSGWPFSVLMCGLVALMLTLKVGNWRRAWPIPAALAVGLALSAPAWLMLLEYSAHTLRATVPFRLNLVWSVPPSSLPGLVFPPWVSEWVASRVKPRQAMEFVGGLVPVVILLAAVPRLGRPFLRQHRHEFLLLALTLLLAMSPSTVGSLRWSFRWLPLFFLMLGLLASHALAELRANAAGVNLGLRCVLLVTSVGLLAWLTGMEPSGFILGQTVALASMGLIWTVAERLRLLATWMPCAVCLTAAWLSYHDVGRFVEFPTWSFDESIRRPGPLDPARRYLSVHEIGDMMRSETPTVLNWNKGIGVGLRPGNAWMYAGVPAVNGYTPMAPTGLYDVFRFVSHMERPVADAERVLEHWSGPSGFLDFAGINGLLVADRYAAQAAALPRNGWQRIADVDGGVLYHRGEPAAAQVRSLTRAWLATDREEALDRLLGEHGPHTPVLVRDAAASGPSLLAFAPAQLTVLRDGRNSVEVEVVNESPDQEALIVVLRPWFPGYRAWLNETPLPVTRVDLTMPAVRLPPGARGRLLLAYRPRSLVIGCWVAGGVAAGLLAVFVRSRLAGSRRRPRPAVASGSPLNEEKGVGMAGNDYWREARGTAGAALLTAVFCITLTAIHPTFFWLDDNQTYHLPGRLEVARIWRQGELPLLTSSSWQCGTVAAQFQYQVFSLFQSACFVGILSLGLSLPASAAALSVASLMVLAVGTHRLARSQGLAHAEAVLVALTASLNGWVIIWGSANWVPALDSFAWLPWSWWALERALTSWRGPARFVPAGVFLYLLITAGWPFSIVMSGLLTLWLVAKTWDEQPRWTAFWPVAAAWLLGLALSAPAWLLIAEYLPHTLRGETVGTGPSMEWSVPPTALPGLVLPVFVSTWPKPGFPDHHVNLELAGGTVPLAILLTAGWRLGRPFWRRHRWLVFLGLFVLLAAMLPGVGTLRFAFRFLPLFFLALGLLSGHALSEVADRKFGLTATLLVLVVWLGALLAGRDASSRTIWVGACLLGLCVLWALLERHTFTPPVVVAWLPCVAALLSGWSVYAAGRESVHAAAWNFPDSVRRPPALSHARRYFSIHTLDDFRGGGGKELLIANSGMYSGVEVVNGYCPMRLRGLAEVCGLHAFGFVTPEHAQLFLTPDSGLWHMLTLMGVDGLIVAERFRTAFPVLEAHGWRQAVQVEGGMVFHRRGLPLPRVHTLSEVEVGNDFAEQLEQLLTHRGPHPPALLLSTEGTPPRRFASARAVPVDASRTTEEVDITERTSGEETLVVFARPWYPGYRARYNGEPVPVELFNLVLPAVRLPAGAGGRLRLEYRPTSLVVGGWVAGFALFTTVGVLLWSAWVRRRAAWA